MQQNHAQVSCAYDLRGLLYVLVNLFRILQHRNDYPVKIDVYTRERQGNLISLLLILRAQTDSLHLPGGSLLNIGSL